ncbi:MAG TPA: hypothetical protein QGI62_10590 [Anaerolineales bacterium]|nr:hypothetical protein [Anaerolineales bacterium]HJO34555.1 hypothetical protein [Anaerolineales bacterium]
MATWAGRWLDDLVGGGRSWFTIGMLVLSVPVVLFLTLRLALRSTRRLTGESQLNGVRDFERDDSSNS